MSIPLVSAALCMDCDRIVEKLDACPVCASKSLLGLAKVINRKEAKTAWLIAL